MHQLGFHESTSCGMLQLGSRQGMRHVQLGFGEQSCKLGSSQLQTHEIVPILAHAHQHYWELNIIVEWELNKTFNCQILLLFSMYLFSACFWELNIIVDSLPKASQILEDMEFEEIIEGPYLVSSL